MNKENFEFGRYMTTYSDSRWADSEEIKKAYTTTKIDIEDGKCPGAGIPVTSDGRTVYVDSTDTHTLIFGSTGSKKTRLFGMPLINMFAMAGESFIATDPKGELFKKTSGLVAANGYNTAVLDFRNLKQSDCWNPLMIPYDLYHHGDREEAVSMLNDFITALSEPQRQNSKDRYWVDMACSQAIANLLFFIDTATPYEANIFSFANFCASKSDAIGVEELSECVADGSVASINYKNILANKEAPMTFGSVSSTLTSLLNIFVIKKSLGQVLSKNTFNIRDLGKQKTAIYIIVPDEKTTMHFLVTAFIKQTYETLIDEAQKHEGNRLPLRLNFVLDEFGNIPKIADMPSMISAARSRNMRFFLMAQGMKQLISKYGEDAHTIKGNCDNWVFLTSREYELLEEISNLCGNTFYIGYDGSIETRPLISVSELQRLSKERGEVLILHGRNYPFVTELPDIDEYKFKSYPSLKPPSTYLPEVALFKADKVIADIKNNVRPLPFSFEVYGKECFYKDTFNLPEAVNSSGW